MDKSFCLFGKPIGDSTKKEERNVHPFKFLPAHDAGSNITGACPALGGR